MSRTQHRHSISSPQRHLHQFTTPHCPPNYITSCKPSRSPPSPISSHPIPPVQSSPV
ncbi:hypothetical protein P153DRAFT_368156 [Dothidotthia symphoricarpi CBS 119687]|uniref:Uncharacterized protein n=1 Tax=Dothidotthia symphoricarpi CBS 119687 TaxID=1392245 RepID=A0A6A6AA34_9PLEO|nr:uncharacterized protein P153DRAFT_368156 [Dothidotthia symphoricarpi CBS 119687]KAF2127541.1 hypothetical protein P153DRAFT_368156 [Dothidotthia symphoricarpi CBS 119687]